MNPELCRIDAMLKKLLFTASIATILLTPSADALTGSRRILLSGPAKLWTPLNLGTTLVAWWDAQDTAHITLNVSSVSNWTDKVGGIAATQATGAQQPGYSATARNGKPGLTFSGTQSLALASIAALPSGTNAVSIAGAAFSSGGSGFPWVFAYGAAAAGQMRGIGGTNGTNQPVEGSIFATNVASSLTWFNQDRFDLFSLPSGASVTASVYVDGNAAVTGSLSPSAVGATGGFIGVRPGATEFWVGTIQQVLVLSSTVTQCQADKLAGWESWYDGKAGANLPVGQPYKNSPPTVGGSC